MPSRSPLGNLSERGRNALGTRARNAPGFRWQSALNCSLDSLGIRLESAKASLQNILRSSWAPIRILLESAWTHFWKLVDTSWNRIAVIEILSDSCIFL